MNGLRQAWSRAVAWYRGAGRAMQIGIGCAALIALCVVCGVGVSAMNGASGASGASKSAPTSNTQVVNHGAQPTASMAATATTGSAAAGQPHLGDPVSAFSATFGKPVTAGLTPGQFNYLSSPGAAHPFLLIFTAGFFGETPAADSFQVDYRSNADNLGGLSHAEALCAQFIPPDAVKGKSVQAIDSTSGKVSALDVIYTSATLAHTFPAADFQDANQNQAQPGSFDVQYLYETENDPGVIADCSLELGTQQTKG